MYKWRYNDVIPNDENGEFLRSLYDKGAFTGSPFNSENERLNAENKYNHMKSTLRRKFPYSVDNTTISLVLFGFVLFFSETAIPYDGDIISIIYNIIRLVVLSVIGVFTYKSLVKFRDNSFDKTFSELSEYTYWEVTIPTDEKDVLRIIAEIEKERGFRQ